MTSATTPETHSGSQPGGLLFKLPIELRLEIYDLIFPRETVGVFAVRKQLLKAANAKVSAGDSVSILATCRVIHDEAKAALYTNTHCDVRCSLELAPAAWRAMVEEKWGPMQWLPRMKTQKSINIQQARHIDLNIMFTVEASWKTWGNTWLDRLPAHVSSFSNLKSLHIKLSSSSLVPFATTQKQADHVLSVLAGLKCSGEITAAMEVSLGDSGFETRSYFNMLRMVGGTDKTQEVYTRELAVLSTQQESSHHELVILSTRLNSTTSERIDIVKEEGWRESLGPRIKARELLREMRTISRSIAGVQSRKQVLEERQKFLLGELSTPLASV